MAQAVAQEDNDREEAILAVDQLTEIQNVVDYLKGECESESLSYGEIITIQSLYETVKEYI